MRRSSLLHAMRVIILLPLVASGSIAQAFTAPALHRRVSGGSRVPVVGSPTLTSASSSPSGSLASRSRASTQLRVRRNGQPDNTERYGDRVNSIIGIDRGWYILSLAVAVSVWFFTVPVEYRRTKICTEAQTRENPDKCMTGAQFTSGIADYYRNGGGIKLDLSVEGRD